MAITKVLSMIRRKTGLKLLHDKTRKESIVIRKVAFRKFPNDY